MQQDSHSARMFGTVFGALLLAGNISASAAEPAYRRVVDGIAVYFGIVPAEMIRGHPAEHPESGMHGGPVAGENHLVVALFHEKTRERINNAEVHARITATPKLDLRKRLEPMLMAGAASYGNYFYMSGSGPYTIVLTIRLPGETRERSATFTWARS